MGYSNYRHTPSNTVGHLYGLPPTDLLDWQLEKINSDKLVELIDTDPRVNSILKKRATKLIEKDSTDLIKLCTILLSEGYEL